MDCPVLENLIVIHFSKIPFYLQYVLIQSANCVKDVYSGM
jgi:hypothetical protein